MAVATVAAGLVVYTLGGDPYVSGGKLATGKLENVGHEEEIPMMLALPGSSALSQNESAVNTGYDWGLQEGQSNQSASYPPVRY